MDEKKPEALNAAGGAAAPQNPRIPAFSANRREIAVGFVMYVAAYLYLNLFLGFLDPSGTWRIWLGVFTVLLVGCVELIHWETKRSRESWVWLGCLAVILIATVTGHVRVWGDGWSVWFLHLCAVWWVMSRSGCLAQGETGCLLPLDGVNGFFLIPFRNLLLRIRTVAWAVGRLFRRQKTQTGTVLWTLGAMAAAAVLFVSAAGLLMAADDNFAGIFSGLQAFLEDVLLWDSVAEFLYRLILSLPVGAWLFGLIAGTGREDKGALQAGGRSLLERLERLRQVPNMAWTVLLGGFCVLYGVFFAIQGQYLFGAFTRTLPEGFIVSAYARQGFFELCRVMAVNFTLLWLVTRLSRTPVGENKPTLAPCLLLLAESMLLAAVAFSKLALYISCFGVTPLRVQSTWLVCVLFFGCLCAGYALITGRKVFRVWVLFAALTLTGLYLF